MTDNNAKECQMAATHTTITVVELDRLKALADLVVRTERVKIKCPETESGKYDEEYEMCKNCNRLGCTGYVDKLVPGELLFTLKDMLALVTGEYGYSETCASQTLTKACKLGGLPDEPA